MKRSVSLSLAILVLWGCSRSEPDKAADVEPVPLQGALLNAPLEPSEKAPAQDLGEGEDVQLLGSEIETTTSSEPASLAAFDEGALASGTTAATEVESASPPGKDEGEYKFVAFDTLADYEYFLTPLNESSLNKQPPKDQIPKHIRSLDQRKVVIEGYMVPIDIEGERIQSFILTNSMMMCCYGAMPWINEWIFVEMEGEEGAGFYNDVVIRTKGVLEVGEEIEDGMIISLYRMKGHQVDSTGEPIPFLFGR